MVGQVMLVPRAGKAWFLRPWTYQAQSSGFLLPTPVHTSFYSLSILGKSS